MLITKKGCRLEIMPCLNQIFWQSFSYWKRSTMPTLPTQLLFPRIILFSKVISLLLVLTTTRYLLLLCTRLVSSRSQQKEEKEEADISYALVEKLRGIFYALMAWLYFLFLACAMALPLQLLSQLTVKGVLPLSCLLLCFCGELLPRVLLNAYHAPSCLEKWVWLIKFAKNIDKIIPLNGLLKRLFGAKVTSQGEVMLTRENVYRMLDYFGERKAVRQEEVELLDKLRLLEGVGVGTVMVPRVNIFLLDASLQLNARLLARLSRYYFTKFLLYSRYEDNVIGYLQFKQLLAYSPDQRIIQQPSSIRRDIVQIREDDNLSTALQRMISKKINFSLVRGSKGELVGLVKLKDIFSRMLLKWYNYGGLTTDQTLYSIGSLGRDRDFLEEAEEQN